MLRNNYVIIIIDRSERIPDMEPPDRFRSMDTEYRVFGIVTGCSVQTVRLRMYCTCAKNTEHMIKINMYRLWIQGAC